MKRVTFRGLRWCFGLMLMLCLAPTSKAQYWDQDGYYHEESQRNNDQYGKDGYNEDDNFYERDSDWDSNYDMYRHSRYCTRSSCDRSCHYYGWNARDHDRHCRRDRCYRSCKYYRPSYSYNGPSTRAGRVVAGVVIGAAILSAVLDRDDHNHHDRRCTRQRCYSSCRYRR